MLFMAARRKLQLVLGDRGAAELLAASLKSETFAGEVRTCARANTLRRAAQVRARQRDASLAHARVAAIRFYFGEYAAV